MPVFEPSVPHETQDPVIEVTFDPDRPLRPGRHVFRLVVVDDAGNESDPDEVTVHVLNTERPTAVLQAPREVPFGVSFELSGRASSDPGGGEIVRYIWTRIE